MPTSLLAEPSQQKRRSALTKTDIVKSPSLRLSVIHSDTADTARPIEELTQAHYRVTAELVLTLEQFMALTSTMQRETVADLIQKGATDCGQVDDSSDFPASILGLAGSTHDSNDARMPTLRDSRARISEEKEGERRSKVPYRAMVENPHGICRCTAKGKLVGVNQALVKMLGCSSKEEVLPADLTSEIIRDPYKRQLLLGSLGPAAATDALEVVWKRKDGSALKAKLSGREVIGTNGRLRGYAIIAEDVTKQRELEEHLRQQAAKDSLTGLDNDQSLLAALTAEIKRSARAGRNFGLLIFALDDLKKVNDQYGPAVGNKALCRLADAVSVGRRRIDISARLSGDKFALMLPETPAEPARLVADRVREALANDGQEPKISASVGIAHFPNDGEDTETLFAAAEQVLQQMKAQVHALDKPPSLKTVHAQAEPSPSPKFPVWISST